jgi:hypothetical protein
MKYNEPCKRSGEDELATGRAARAVAEELGEGRAHYLTMVWNHGESRDLDMLFVLEAPDEDTAQNIFRTLGERQDATVSVMPAMIRWEKELDIQGKL